MPVVEFQHVDVIFGRAREAALALLDKGESRDRILADTQVVVGVADANLSVQAGQICVLMGLSGSGKSTLLRCVNGLNEAARGKVLVSDGDSRVDIPSTDPTTLRRLRTERIAMVFQQFALLPWRTVAENVGFGLELRGVSKAERERIVDEKLELVGLTQWKDKYAHELSGGMQQRVGLARAFATDADILLMDEPFSALDPLIREHLQDELCELQDSLHKTIIFVSHDLDEALKIGNHIAIMEGGRIVQQGSPEEIVLRPSNDYVAQFVANMNPLRVLNAAALMTPIDGLPREGDAFLIDPERRVRLTVGESNEPLSVSEDGRSCPLAPFPENADAGEGTSAAVLMARPETRMRDLVAARHAVGRPILVVDGERLIGVVGEKELYRGLLRQGKATRSN